MGRPDPPGDVGTDAARRKLDPDPRVFAQLAEAYRREGLLEEAIQICREGLAAHPADAGGRAVLGRALLERGWLDEAEREFRRVLEQAPKDLPALRSLGEICARKGRAEEARQYCEQALRLEPGDLETENRLAALPAIQKADAFKEPLQARRWDRDPLASLTLAALYASQGHPGLAEAIYSQLGRRPGEGVPPSTRADVSERGAPVSSMLEKLLSLRQAARRVREAGRAGAGPDASHGR